jgi:hypothetical protein
MSLYNFPTGASEDRLWTLCNSDDQGLFLQLSALEILRSALAKTTII